MEYQPVKLAEWGRQYGEVHCASSCAHLLTIFAGDIVFAKFFRTPAIILNSKEAAEELLEKRSAKYSDRPRFILLNEM